MTALETERQINVPLLRKTLEHIEAHPQEWRQERWHCETGMCFAGTACDLDGGQWAATSGPTLMQRSSEPDEDQYPGVGSGRIHAATRARRVLGITHAAANRLFDPKNTMHDLRERVADLCGGDL